MNDDIHRKAGNKPTTRAADISELSVGHGVFRESCAAANVRHACESRMKVQMHRMSQTVAQSAESTPTPQLPARASYAERAAGPLGWRSYSERPASRRAAARPRGPGRPGRYGPGRR